MRAGIGPLGGTVGLLDKVIGEGFDVLVDVGDEGEGNFNIEDGPEATTTGTDDTTALVITGVAGTETEGAVATVFREDTIDAFSLSISVLSTIHFNHSGLE